MENNLFQQAKDAVTNFMNGQGNANASPTDQQAAQNAIQAAYNDASPEEKQQLQQLEQQLKQRNQLS
ncbi:hypothetical protein CIL03_14855 [Virgibacillus indicus]|uniref:DUF3813 domain-containing protein n=1 Tax=Virgibacillus indicus TaxID=2024554 RepID=A0A265N947_9BACI|nr:DUF3813 family protein [Virgibacillus indicus]OZU87979.1 hypothetical protein CIL03_14855 [Virgibacillus indicus]